MLRSRRRFLTLASAACLTAAVPAHAYRWRGVALGARAQILLDHPDAPQIAEAARAEIVRLERIFSLYQPNSELVRLNRDGTLRAPSFELLDCLFVARNVHRLTHGAFDPTVQPLWQVMAESLTNGKSPTPEQISIARSRIGFDRVRFEGAAIKLDPGQALTPNGIAQGYIADRVAGLMRSLGVTDVLIDTGELVALGAPNGEDTWPVTIANSKRTLALENRALATSATRGAVLDRKGRQGHILAPDGLSSVPAVQVSVSADSAALADGLSTGLCLVGTAHKAELLLREVKDARLESFINLPDRI